MLYKILAETYSRAEATTKRLELLDIIVSLLMKTPPGDLKEVIYLTQGDVAPPYEGLELGVADKLSLKAISLAYGIPTSEIEKRWKRVGDLGLAAEEMCKGKKQVSLFSEPLTVKKVYNNFLKIASKEGERSQEFKIKLIAELLNSATPLEARYIIRTVSGRLRLGIADMTILDALSYRFEEGFDGLAEMCSALQTHPPGVDDVCEKLKERTSEPLYAILESLKRSSARTLPGLEELYRAAEKVKRSIEDNRVRIERAYNIYPDLGEIAVRLAEGGVKSLEEMHPVVGIPLRAMLAERLRSMEEIFEKMGGRCALEYKYDGLRVQIHVDGERVELYSRHLERLTEQFPDVVETVKRYFRGREGIVEGECVPVDLNTGEMLPFQVVSRRRGRKYGIEEAVEEFPVVTFLFDCMYADGVDMTRRPLPERRKAIMQLFPEIGEEWTEERRLALSKQIITSDVREAERFFTQALSDGCEGIMAKNISEKSIYSAGSRGWLWIKYKKEYKSELTDSIDLVVVGAFWGKGRRAGTYGALLMACYNPNEDRFETVCKLGTGFS
ncbi:MAG: ATP-dependent DNA ligase, partial [Thermoplasmata archaeon]|nr:ATP-dependent DNA ligase [Thermoplasmata archaeon]